MRNKLRRKRKCFCELGGVGKRCDHLSKAVESDGRTPDQISNHSEILSERTGFSESLLNKISSINAMDLEASSDSSDSRTSGDNNNSSYSSDSNDYVYENFYQD